MAANTLNSSAGYEYVRCNSCGIYCNGPGESFSSKSEGQNAGFKINFPSPWLGVYVRKEGLKLVGNNPKIHILKEFGHFYITFNKDTFQVQRRECKKPGSEEKTQEEAVNQQKPIKSDEHIYNYSRYTECGMQCKGPQIPCEEVPEININFELNKPFEIDIPFPAPWSGTFSSFWGLKITDSAKKVIIISQDHVDFSITFSKGKDPRISKIRHRCLNPSCPTKKPGKPT